jgi:hypothetical protein
MATNGQDAPLPAALSVRLLRLRAASTAPGGSGVERLPNQAACVRQQRELRKTWPSAYCIEGHNEIGLW